MNNLFKIIICAFMFGTTNFISAQLTLIPDTNFEQSLINLSLDSPPIDGSVLTSNIDTLRVLDVSNKSIYDLTGIEDFSSLEELYCQFNFIDTLILTQNNNLNTLNCTDNVISWLDVSQNYNLLHLSCRSNLIDSLDLSADTLLGFIDCRDNELANLDVSNNTGLYYFNCSNNHLLRLDVTSDTILSSLFCFGNSLSQLNLDYNSVLRQLYCFNNQIGSLDLSQNTMLEHLYASNNNMFCLNVKNGNNINFISFDVSNNAVSLCVEVDDSTYAANNWINIDSPTYFHNSCFSSCVVGVTEITQDAKYTLYPNPILDFVHIKGDLSEIKQLAIYSSSGKLLQTIEGNKITSIVDAKKLPKGLYIINLIKDDEISSYKIVKQN